MRAGTLTVPQSHWSPQGCGESDPGLRFWRPPCFRNTSPLERRKATFSGRLLGYQVWISPGLPQRLPLCSCLAVACRMADVGTQRDEFVPLLSHIGRLSNLMPTSYLKGVTVWCILFGLTESAAFPRCVSLVQRRQAPGEAERHCRSGGSGQTAAPAIPCRAGTSGLPPLPRR